MGDAKIQGQIGILATAVAGPVVIRVQIRHGTIVLAGRTRRSRAACRRRHQNHAVVFEGLSIDVREIVPYRVNVRRPGVFHLRDVVEIVFTEAQLAGNAGGGDARVQPELLGIRAPRGDQLVRVDLVAG